LAVVVACSPLTSSSQDRPRGFAQSKNPHIEKWAYILMASKWPAPPVVYVCWENPNATDAKEREWVAQAVTDSWQRASALQFKGWGSCAPKVEGVRVRIADDGPHVKALGRGLDNLADGMVLNFSFNNWSPVCKKDEAQRKLCIQSIAVHEFGHAIGFAHEQNRPDAPGECAMLAQGTSGDTPLTPYDPSSVMNYCNPVYNNNGKLSDLDAQAVRELYPPAS
jgi:Astacin (Peptidase family M12A)